MALDGREAGRLILDTQRCVFDADCRSGQISGQVHPERARDQDTEQHVRACRRRVFRCAAAFTADSQRLSAAADHKKPDGWVRDTQRRQRDPHTSLGGTLWSRWRCIRRTRTTSCTNGRSTRAKHRLAETALMSAR